MPSTPMGDANEPFTGGLEQDDAADAFLALLADKEEDASKKPSDSGEEGEGDEPSKKKKTESDDHDANDDTDQSEETPDEDGEEEGDEEAEGEEKDEGDDDKPASKKKYADDSDETYVKIKVGDDEHEVPVKDLKRLFGQEAALTKRSQEVAQKSKDTEAQVEKNTAAYNVLLKRASERADEFRKVDWMGLAKDPNVTADEAKAFHAMAQKAFEEEAFIKNELDGFMQAVGEATKAEQATQARNCIKSLTSEKTEKGEANPLHIPGWDDKVYGDLRSFAVDMGMSKDVVNQLRDPAAFKMMHMAMQFAKGAKQVKTVKVDKAPKKIVKSSSSPAAQTPSTKVAQRKADTRLRNEQTVEAAEDAFLARLNSRD